MNEQSKAARQATRIVKMCAKRWGVDPKKMLKPPKRMRYTDALSRARADAMFDLKAEGWSHVEIAEIFGIAPTSITNMIKQHLSLI